MAQVGVWYFTVAEVCERLRLSRATVYAQIRSGDLPAIRVGTAYKVPVTALGLTPPSPLACARWEQLELPFDPPLRRVRVWRNTGKPVNQTY